MAARMSSHFRAGKTPVHLIGHKADWCDGGAARLSRFLRSALAGLISDGVPLFTALSTEADRAVTPDRRPAAVTNTTPFSERFKIDTISATWIAVSQAEFNITSHSVVSRGVEGQCVLEARAML
ncbi:hypothetical protein E4U40_005138 [Claviceps sp. LM458 group G5]|nr:hypothetical protein E4U40_005138 [Claviceps sp. LM458 group G5]